MADHTPAQPASQGMLYGTLDALILKILAPGRRHGYAIAQLLQEATHQEILIGEGSLYPALYRMEREGWIRAEWGMSELGRKAKFYRLTAAGRRQLARETAQWARFAAVVSRVLFSS
jgi:PadR family transcriptional regulator PadR